MLGHEPCSQPMGRTHTGARGKVWRGRSGRGDIMGWPQSPFSISLYYSWKRVGRGSWMKDWSSAQEKGHKGQGVLFLTSQILFIVNKLGYFSPSWAWFANDGNWLMISLPLSCFCFFFHLFSPYTVEKRALDISWVDVWQLTKGNPPQS